MNLLSLLLSLIDMRQIMSSTRESSIHCETLMLSDMLHGAEQSILRKVDLASMPSA